MTCVTSSADVLERVQSSQETILVPVQVIEDGDVIDPTGFVVTASVVDAGSGPGTFVSATWDTDTNTDPDTYAVEVLIGPGSTIGTLDFGDHWVYVEIDTTPGPVVLLSPSTLRIV